MKGVAGKDGMTSGRYSMAMHACMHACMVCYRTVQCFFTGIHLQPDIGEIIAVCRM